MKTSTRLIYSLLIVLLTLLSATSSLAQSNEIEVSGVVKDEAGIPLAGVSVMIPKTQIGVSTGYEGKYKIKVKKGSKLTFSFIGFKNVTITVEKNNYNIVMKEDHSTLNQVVVTGYSQVELRKNTGAVSIINSEDLKDSPLKNVDQLLQGKLAGVNIKMTSGRPGAVAKVRIRGTNTITGNAEPLWVIDGVPLQKSIPIMNNSQIKSGDFDNIFATGIGSINPNDIESITVLKDAAAAAIYGSQAASGVIVVTTKKGEAGKARVSYSGSVSVQIKPSRDANLMNSQEKLNWEQELWDEFSKDGYEQFLNNNRSHYPVIGIVGQMNANKGKFENMTKEDKDAYLNDLRNHSTDWFDVLFRNSVSNSHYISISGGSSKSTYYVSGGFNQNKGLVKKNQADNYSFNTKIDFNPTNWMKLSFNTDFSYMKSKAPSNNVDMFKYAYFANPYERLYNSDGSYRADETYFSMSMANGKVYRPTPPIGFNIMREINETSSKATSSTFSIKGNTTINIAKGLTFSGLASFSYSGDLSENINGKNTYAAWNDRPFENDPTKSKRVYGSITQLSSVNTSYLLRGQLNYAKTFGEHHHLSVIGGSEIRNSYSRSITTKRYGYDPVTGNHSTPLYEVGENNQIGYNKLISFGNILDALSGQSKLENAFASFYATSSYNYKNKYIGSFTVRSDGSNNFGSNEQFNLNWSISGAWNIDEEPWMQNLSNVISTLSLRGGFGYTGGVNPSVYPVLIMNYLSTFRNSETDFYRIGQISNAPNPNLRWEKNRTFNIGMNIGFLKDRITSEISYYRNKNLDQVTPVKVTTSTGFYTQSYNTSEQVNNGVEFTLGANILNINNFNWRITGNIAYNFNKLTKYVSPTGNIMGENYVGYPLGRFFTGKPTGINKETGLYGYKLRDDIIIRSVSDYTKFENYLFYIGTRNAPWNGGFSTSLSYKNLSMNIVGNFSIGGKIVNNIDSPASYNNLGASLNERIPSSQNDLYRNYLNVRKDVTNRWTPNNPITNGYPRIIDGLGPKLVDTNGNYILNRQVTYHGITDGSMVENLSYLKISSISLSYSLPKKFTQKLQLGGASVGLLMNNLFIITGYKGIDPEIPGAVYPQSRSFSFNVSLNF